MFSNHLTKEKILNNKEKYDHIFIDCFSIDGALLNDQFVYQCIPAWDSVGHMGLIAALESEFEITMDTDDIIDFGSYTRGMELLLKYGVTI